MSGRIVRHNDDGTVTTIDDGVERTWNLETWELLDYLGTTIACCSPTRPSRHASWASR